VSAVILEQISKQYRGPPSVTAVDGISLDIPAGQIYGLLGPNGAGKTTTIGICTTRVRPTAGRAVVAGHDVAADPVAVRASIGVVSQAVTLDRSCTIAENLEFHCRYFGMTASAARQRARELLERFRIADRADALPGQLSGGLAQRVQLARAVSHRPAVLFLDEPTAGLDPQSRLALWDLVRSLKDEGMTIVLTTHYMEEADQLCERLAVVDHGRVLREGRPDALKRELGGTTVVDAALGDVEAARAALAGLAIVREVQPSPRGLRVLLDASPGALAELLGRLVAFGLRDLSIVEPSLETVFITLTGRDLRE
jgi:ABC-2 type transport system ATP-binding protein